MLAASGSSVGNDHVPATDDCSVMENLDRETSRPAIDRLAERLHWKQHHLSPGPVEERWSDLSQRERDYYRLSIKALLDERSLLEALISDVEGPMLRNN